MHKASGLAEFSSGMLLNMVSLGPPYHQACYRPWFLWALLLIRHVTDHGFFGPSFSSGMLLTMVSLGPPSHQACYWPWFLWALLLIRHVTDHGFFGPSFSSGMLLTMVSLGPPSHQACYWPWFLWALLLIRHVTDHGFFGPFFMWRTNFWCIIKQCQLKHRGIFIFQTTSQGCKRWCDGLHCDVENTLGSAAAGSGFP